MLTVHTIVLFATQVPTVRKDEKETSSTPTNTATIARGREHFGALVGTATPV
jgi:hypothetical protein